MKAYELMIYFQDFLKSMSKVGIKVSDYQYVPLYRDYLIMKEKGEKRDYIYCILSEKYNISTRTIRRVIKRLEIDVKS